MSLPDPATHPPSVDWGLGATTTPRMEWDSYDLKTPEGVLVEVKSSVYLQTWYQERESRPTFGVSKK